MLWQGRAWPCMGKAKRLPLWATTMCFSRAALESRSSPHPEHLHQHQGQAGSTSTCTATSSTINQHQHCHQLWHTPAATLRENQLKKGQWFFSLVPAPSRHQPTYLWTRWEVELGKALSPGPGADMATSGRSCSTGMSLPTSLPASSLLPISLPTSSLLPNASNCFQVLPRWPSLAL